MPVNYREVAYIRIHILSSHQALSAEVFWKGKEMRILALKEQIVKGDCGEPGVILNKRDPYLLWHSSCILVFFSPMAHKYLAGQGLFIIEALLSHSDTLLSVGIFWTRGRLFAQNSTCQQTTLTRDRHL